MVNNNHGHLVTISSSAGLIGVNGLAGNTCIHIHIHQGLDSPLEAHVISVGLFF